MSKINLLEKFKKQPETEENTVSAAVVPENAFGCCTETEGNWYSVADGADLTEALNGLSTEGETYVLLNDRSKFETAENTEELRTLCSEKKIILITATGTDTYVNLFDGREYRDTMQNGVRTQVKLPTPEEEAERAKAKAESERKAAEQAARRESGFEDKAAALAEIDRCRAALEAASAAVSEARNAYLESDRALKAAEAAADPAELRTLRSAMALKRSAWNNALASCSVLEKRLEQAEKSTSVFGKYGL